MRKSNNQMYLGELIAVLKRKDQERPVTFGFDYAKPTGLHSYRGYYEDLAIGYERHAECTVGQFVARLEEANGTVMTGWKGGEYVMNDDTAVWMSKPGESTGMAIIDVVEVGYSIWLKTELVD
jgi:hypothetical protein